VNRKSVIPVLAATAIAVVAAGGVIAMRAAQPTYRTNADGIALGPAATHAHAGTDVLVQIAMGALTTAAGNASGPLAVVTDASLGIQEQALLDMTNADRAQNGLPPLTFDPASLQVARVRATAQIPEGPLSHYNSLGEIAFVGLLADAGVQYALAGENLARASGQDRAIVAQLNEALMNSPAHRANILEPSFNHLAVGAATGPDGRLAFAEIFRTFDDQ
jgi:uncharacterized protein YkwD